MRMAVKTSPITAAPPFSVYLTGERERADGFTVSVLAGETALGWTGFARRCARLCRFTVPPLSPLLDYFGLDTTPAAYASVAIDPTATLAVHCGNGFDAGFSPYQSARLSRYNAVS